MENTREESIAFAKPSAPAAVMPVYLNEADAVAGRAPRQKLLCGSMKLRISDVNSKALKRFYEPDFSEAQFKEVELPYHTTLGNAAVSYLKNLGEWDEHSSVGDAHNAALYCRVKFRLMSAGGDKDIILRFGGVEPACEIYLNGRPVGKISDGFTPAEFTVNDYLAEGENLLALKVFYENTGLADWTNRSIIGIYKDIYFIKRPKTGFADIYVHSVYENEKPYIAADVSVSAKSDEFIKDGALLKGSLYDADGRLVCTDEKEVWGFGRHSFKTIRMTFRDKTLCEWSPDDPQVYTLAVSLCDSDGKAVDVRAVKCGISLCEVRTEIGKKDITSRLLHNKMPVKLYGALYEGFSKKDGFAPDSEEYVEKLALLKENGFNAVRLTAPSEELLCCCDALGMYAVCVCPLNVPPRAKRKIEGRTDPVYAALERLAAMVAQFKNHPSVIMWEISCTEEYPRATFANLAKTLDDSRPVLCEGDLSFGVSDLFAAADCSDEELLAIARGEAVKASKGMFARATKDYRVFPFLLTEYAKNDNIISKFGMINAYDRLAGAFCEKIELTEKGLSGFRNAFRTKASVNAAQSAADKKTSVTETVKAAFKRNDAATEKKI